MDVGVGVEWVCHILVCRCVFVYVGMGVRRCVLVCVGVRGCAWVCLGVLLHFILCILKHILVVGVCLLWHSYYLIVKLIFEDHFKI